MTLVSASDKLLRTTYSRTLRVQNNKPTQMHCVCVGREGVEAQLVTRIK